jgi:pyruvate,orthophosphate dikinase
MATHSDGGDKLIYRFRPGFAEGRAEWRELLGGKGANLAEMARMEIPVPPGFTITTSACRDFQKSGGLSDELLQEVEASIRWLEETTGKKFGAAENPLLVSVRSGAPTSMPGMMDTVLNLGLSGESVKGLERRATRRFALDSYRRLLAMFGDVVLGVPSEAFLEVLEGERRRFAERASVSGPGPGEDWARVVPDSRLDEEALEAVIEGYLAAITRAGREFPTSPEEQLKAAIAAVFSSWDNPRAKLYRRLHGVSDAHGTAVNVQAMVFGNLGPTSATGVAFTRDPSTGEKRFFGEWLENAQGEDVVAGVRTPLPLSESAGSAESLERRHPDAYRELFRVQERLERHFRDMQDLEFTIEDGRLFLLQTRRGKRSARAAVRIAVEFAREGLLSHREALLSVDPERLRELMFPTLQNPDAHTPLARGIGASPGAVSGALVFSSQEAEKRKAAGEKVILMRLETSPEDLLGMESSVGIVTARGGATSHAAVVARGMGCPCVVGCGALVPSDAGFVVMSALGPLQLSLGKVITIDGMTGAIYEGELETSEGSLGEDAVTLLSWANRASRMGVRANADTPEAAARALEFGAQGIGLCRTEHMFFEKERLAHVREMILARDGASRERALDKLLPDQKSDFEELFRTMRGLPVTIRLLDPPLHEFLPHDEAAAQDMAERLKVDLKEVRARVTELSEQNPMLGHRGVRLAVSYPEIAQMQVRAILGAACVVKAEGIDVHPEIMIPLVLSGRELDMMRALVDEVARDVFAQTGTAVAFKFGTMIDLAIKGEFFSFGTNDLTQTTLGLSRDDSGRFLPGYVERGILAHDPFKTLDMVGVGELVKIAVERGRSMRPDIKLGLCGEHGGDPASIEHCEALGLDYVSCSPFRIPIARLAVAQAAIRKERARLASDSVRGPRVL